MAQAVWKERIKGYEASEILGAHFSCGGPGSARNEGLAKAHRIRAKSTINIETRSVSCRVRITLR